MRDDWGGGEVRVTEVQWWSDSRNECPGGNVEVRAPGPVPPRCDAPLSPTCMFTKMQQLVQDSWFA